MPTRESFIRAIPASAAPISAPERTTFTTAAGIAKNVGRESVCGKRIPDTMAEKRTRRIPEASWIIARSTPAWSRSSPRGSS